MGKKDIKNKIKTNCPICNKELIKQYLSQHIRGRHPNDNYCKFVCRGTTYNAFNNSNNVDLLKDKQFYCKQCHKTMNIYSKYKHFKTKMHVLLGEIKNKGNIGPIENNNNYIQINQKTEEGINKNNEKNSCENKKKLIYNSISSIPLNKNQNDKNDKSNNVLKTNEGTIKCLTLGKKPEVFSESSSKLEESSSFKESSSSKSNNILRSRDSDSSSSFPFLKSKRKNDYSWGPDSERIEKEVKEVVRRIEEYNKKNRKIAK